jgi:hypothetical protein
MGLADLTRQPVDHHRQRVPSIVDEHPVTTQMRLSHRDRKPSVPRAVELAKTAVPVAVGMRLDILIPQNLQRDVLALELAVHSRPVRFRPIALPVSRRRHAIERKFERGVRQPVRQRPHELRCPKALQHHANARTANAYRARHFSPR